MYAARTNAEGTESRPVFSPPTSVLETDKGADTLLLMDFRWPLAGPGLSCPRGERELLSIVVDQFLSRRRFWALQVPVPLLWSGGGRGGLPSLDPWHVAAQRVTHIDGGLVDRDVLHGSVQIELVAV